MKTTKKSNIWIPAAIILVLVVLGVFLMPPATSPPGWDETHITFDSDEDMASYCDWLVLDTEGITVTHASRCLSFASSQDLDQKNWSSLEVSYLISNDDVELSMCVYPGDLESTDGFPVNNLEIDELTVNGVQILYQKFEDRTNSFRSLFIYNDYTYEVTVYSPTNADVLIEYLQRILSNQSQTSIDS